MVSGNHASTQPAAKSPVGSRPVGPDILVVESRDEAPFNRLLRGLRLEHAAALVQYVAVMEDGFTVVSWAGEAKLYRWGSPHTVLTMERLPDCGPDHAAIGNAAMHSEDHHG